MNIVTWIQLIYENFYSLVMIFLWIMAQILTGFAIDFGPNEMMNTDGMNFTFLLPHYGIGLKCHGFVNCNRSVFTYVTLLLCNN